MQSCRPNESALLDSSLNYSDPEFQCRLRSSTGRAKSRPPLAQPLATNSNLYQNIRFGSLAAHHSLHLTVRFQYEGDIHQRLLSSVSGHKGK